MNVDDRAGRAGKGKPYTVVMKSRDNQRVLVQDPLDVQFLELADAFQMKARAITGETPKSRRDERTSR